MHIFKTEHSYAYLVPKLNNENSLVKFCSNKEKQIPFYLPFRT